MALKVISFVEILTSQRISLRNALKVDHCKYSTSKNKEKPNIPKNVIENVISAQHQQENGIVYDKKPFKITLEAGKKYSWCLCGRSKNNPFCDGAHKQEQLKIKQKPIRFVVEETKDYWLCNCKQTKARPFCDGTHKLPIVQDAVSVIK